MATILPDEQELLFSELIGLLRQNGFHIVEDHYVRLYALLDRYPFDNDPENLQHELKTLLCPIFATSKKQQNTFYHLFDQHYPFQGQQPSPPSPDIKWNILIPGGTENKQTPPSKWLYIIGTVIVIALITWFLWWTLHAIDQPVLEPEHMLPPPPIAPEGTLDLKNDISKVAPSFLDTLLSMLKSLSSNYTAYIPLMLLLAALVAQLSYKRYRVCCRQWVLERHSAQTPPFSCSITVPDRPSEIFEVDCSYQAARQLRRKSASDQYTIDMPGTITATIQAGGFPRLLFKPVTKLPEYLVLIDWATARDHQAQAYADLVRYLDQQGLYITRYFYDGDPRTCWRDTRQTHYTLADLQEKHAGCRLVIIGDGDRLCDPLTGHLEPWVDTLTIWTDRAILTPALFEQCGPREITLASQFILLPATSKGLLALAEHFEIAGTAVLDSWVDSRGKQPDYLDNMVSEEGTNKYLVQLEHYLGQELFQWVCACAVYPELHWDLTLVLGRLPDVGENLLTEDNLLRLIRLPWFRSGEIPTMLRWLLIQKLKPEAAATVRRELISILKTIKPKEGTFAADNHCLNLSVQGWLLARDRKSLRAIKKVLTLLPQSYVKQDYVLTRLLERTPSSAYRAGRDLLKSLIDSFNAKPFPSILSERTPSSTYHPLGDLFRSLIDLLNAKLFPFLARFKLIPTLSIAVVMTVMVAVVIQSPDFQALWAPPGPPLVSDSGVSTGRPVGLEPSQRAQPQVALEDVFFDFDRSSLNDTAKEILQRNAKILKDNPTIGVIVQGLEDERHTPDYALVIGERRAQAVRRYLIDLGVKNEIRSQSFGKERPFCQEHNESCYQQNRRVHFVVQEPGPQKSLEPRANQPKAKQQPRNISLPKGKQGTPTTSSIITPGPNEERLQ